MQQPAKRVKISRKALRAPDEFHTISGRVTDWARQHLAVLGGAGVLLVGLLIGIGVLGWHRATQAEAAALRFRDAHAAFAADKLDEALASFLAVAADYPQTPSGRLAILYRAHALIRQGKAEEAATAYGEYLATSPPSEALRQVGLSGLAHARELAGDQAGALASYTDAAAVPGPLRTDALLAAARLNESGGNVARAKELYRQVPPGEASPELRDLLAAKLSGEPSAPAPTP
jgi:predicted negative regulator of RcsB-dependent stress response